MTGPAGSNAFADAPLLPLGESSAPTDSTGFTREAGEPSLPGWEGDPRFVRTAWWKFQPTVERTITVDTMGSIATGGSPDTLLAIWEGTSLASLAFITYDDDSGADATSKLTFRGLAGHTYYAQVGDYDSDTPVGTYVLRVTEILPPTGLQGSTTIADAVVLPEGMTSPPQLMRTNDELWWRVIPSQDGELVLDTALSTNVDGSVSESPSNDLEIYTANVPDPVTRSDLTYQGDSDSISDTDFRALLNHEVTAGTEYWVWAKSYGFADILVRLRFTGYRTFVSDWQETPDMVAVWNQMPANVPGPMHHPPSAPEYRVIKNDFSGAAESEAMYGANFDLYKSIGGPQPADDMNAINCSWTHARHHTQEDLLDFWGQDPESPVWGTGGVCKPIPTHGVASGRGVPTNLPVGYSFLSDIDGGLGGSGRRLSFYITAQQQVVRLHRIQAQLQEVINDNGPDESLAQPYVDELTEQGYTGIVLEWEEGEAAVQVTGLEVSPDEPTSGLGADTTIPVCWYITSLADRTFPAGTVPNTWGPYLGVGSGGGHQFAGAADGPEVFAASAVKVPDYNGGTAGWTAVPDEMLDAAWAYESSNSTPLFGTGLALVCVPIGIFSDGPPGELGPYGTAGMFNRVAQRTYQWCALRTTSSTPRFRVSAVPPTVTIDVGVLKVWSAADNEWLWQGHGSVSGATGVGRFKVWTEDGWQIAEPVAGEGGAGRIKVWDGSQWIITTTVGAAAP
jgi:hypothetical protein